jgi:hypothetical protein
VFEGIALSGREGAATRCRYVRHAGARRSGAPRGGAAASRACYARGKHREPPSAPPHGHHPWSIAGSRVVGHMGALVAASPQLRSATVVPGRGPQPWRVRSGTSGRIFSSGGRCPAAGAAEGTSARLSGAGMWRLRASALGAIDAFHAGALAGRRRRPNAATSTLARIDPGLLARSGPPSRRVTQREWSAAREN